MKKLLTILLCSASATFGLAQQQTYFSNPVIHGDLADPSVMRIGGDLLCNRNFLGMGSLLSGILFFRSGQLETGGTCIRPEAGLDQIFFLGSGVVLPQRESVCLLYSP